MLNNDAIIVIGREVKLVSLVPVPVVETALA
jgi:hypothetical protein